MLMGFKLLFTQNTHNMNFGNFLVVYGQPHPLVAMPTPMHDIMPISWDCTMSCDVKRGV